MSKRKTTTRQKRPEAPKRPRPGIKITFSASCAPCQWQGPARATQGEAEIDLGNHRAQREIYCLPCSKMYRKIDEEDRRKGWG